MYKIIYLIIIVFRYSGKFFRTGRAADCTLGAGNAVGIFHECVRIVITACVTAAAAVCAGELRTHQDEFLIFLYVEYLGGIRKDDRSDQANCKYEYDRSNDLAHQ